MPTVRYIWRLYAGLLIAALPWMSLSCAKEPVEAAGGTEYAVAIGATVSPDRQSRVYVEEGPIVQGTYYLYYRPTGSSYYLTALVDFGDPEGPATGFAYTLDGDTRKDLKWKHVYDSGKSSQSYYLCNVDPNLYTIQQASSWQLFRFNRTDVDNPFVIGPLDEEEGTNDILSGSLSSVSSMTGKKLEFTLNHALSLLQVNIDVYPAGEDYVDLSRAEVTISNLCTTLGAFSLTAPTAFVYNASTAPQSTSNGTYRELSDSPIALVDPEDGEKNCWQEDGIFDPEDAGDAKMRYRTKRFVIPPQPIPPTSGAGRPMLTVKVPKRDALGGQSGGDGEFVTYAGYIPEIMFNDNGIPEDIAFKSGYQLTITASIDSPNPELMFAPVRVERWVNKGSHTFKIKQAGIYDADDFNNLMKLYGRLQSSELTDAQIEICLAQLEKYGYRADNYFVFQFWANMSFDLDEMDIERSMQVTGNAPQFAFMFNGYTVTLKSSGADDRRLRGAAGQMELYGMVTGEPSAFTGITSREEMVALIKKLNGEEPATLGEMMRYGVLNNFDDTIEFAIMGSFDVDIEEIFRSVPQQFQGYDISFRVYDGAQVRVLFPSDDDVMECGPAGYCPLSTLMPKRSASGIYSPDEFYLLTECYNRWYPLYNDILLCFGYLSGSTWTFSFRNNMVLDGRRTYLSMIPDTANGRPNYGISIIGATDKEKAISIEHDLVPAATSSGTELYSMLSGQGKTSTQAAFSTLVTNYNSNSNNRVNYQGLWSNGYFDVESRKWTFRLAYKGTNATNGQYIAYSSLFGKMIPSEVAGKYDYEFDLGDTYVIVRTVPNDDGLDTSTDNYRYFYQDGSDKAYPNTADDLKRMALGTYWESETGDEP